MARARWSWSTCFFAGQKNPFFSPVFERVGSSDIHPFSLPAPQPVMILERTLPVWACPPHWGVWYAKFQSSIQYFLNILKIVDISAYRSTGSWQHFHWYQYLPCCWYVDMLNSDQHNIFIDINILQDCQYIGLSICLIDISNTPTSTQVVQETQKRAPLTNGSGNTHSRYKSNALCGPCW